MPKIQLLDSTVSDQIAAGEVVERPSSVVKELVENALDAGAASVRVDLEEAGRGLIRVSDDGEGMEAEDLALSVLRHATSKIRSSADLARLDSFGFRGEALPSIASVSMLRLLSRALGAEQGHVLDVEGGKVGVLRPQGRAQGSTVEVRRLFYNVPARLKFLKADSTESGRINTEMGQMALARPDVAFSLSHDGRSVLDLPRTGDPLQRLAKLWGASMASAALAVDHSEFGLRVWGWVAPPQLSQARRSGQWLYVNGRVVEHRLLGYQLSQAFGSLLPHGRHAVAALFIEIPGEDVDVNVHPAKREVRFRREGQVLDCLRHAVGSALRAANLYTGVDLSASASQGNTPGAWNPGAARAYPEAGGWGPAQAGPSWPVSAASGGQGEAASFLDRLPDTAKPSHVEASPWTLPRPRRPGQTGPLPWPSSTVPTSYARIPRGWWWWTSTRPMSGCSMSASSKPGLAKPSRVRSCFCPKGYRSRKPRLNDWRSGRHL